MRSSPLLFLTIGPTLVAAAPTLAGRGPDPANTFLINFFTTALCDQNPAGSLGFTDLDGPYPYYPGYYPHNCITNEIFEEATFPYAKLGSLSGEFENCTVTIYSDTYETPFYWLRVIKANGDG